MPLILRDYQQELDHEVMEALDRYRTILTVLATGGGKTIIFSSQVQRLGVPSCVVAHRKEILTQISLALGKLEVEHRIVAPDDVVRIIRRKHLKKLGRCWINTGADVGVASVQTLTAESLKRNARIQAWLKRIEFVILDEAHHYVIQGQWGRVLEFFKHCHIVGYTATPERADGKGLGIHADGFAEHMIVGPSSFDLIQAGWLVPFSYHAPTTNLDFENLPITASGDINTKKMRSRIEQSTLVGDIFEHFCEFAQYKKTLVFANDLKSAQEQADRFNANGIRAVALFGETDPSVRERELEGFDDGSGAQVLVNVDLFDEGFDVPSADCAIMGRATFSVSKFLQSIGRVLRPDYLKGYDMDTVAGRKAAIANSNKPKAVIIDPVSNWERNGMPTWPRGWTLDAREKQCRVKPNDEALIPQRKCLGPTCYQPFPRYHKVCPWCGHPVEYIGRDNIEHVGGDLRELDVDALNALFAKLRTANMSEDEYSRRLIADRVPPLVRSKNLKRFRETKHRRTVLKELIAWWCGMQEHRPEDEIQRRFYSRFGIDLVTAQTLNARETDALMERIVKRFQDDIIDNAGMDA